MKCETSILEIESILMRIKNNDINLQPDFQRGEVWSTAKKKKLIDSIIRGWKIPPIHMVQAKEAVDEVLDGQQRLVAIRDYYEGKFSVDGNIPPYDEKVCQLDGLDYENLPLEDQRMFRKYTITLIRLTEYKSEEPAELFYRLNQPASLTSAEQRNAYIGETRDQIKQLVNKFIEMGAEKDKLGFSNSRLAYDEILSKFCYSIEIGTLRKKISANDISEKYRSDNPFRYETMLQAEKTIQLFMEMINCNTIMDYYKVKFSKATLFSWLIYIKNNLNTSSKDLADLLFKFEVTRDVLKGKIKNTLLFMPEDWVVSAIKKYSFLEVMINTYNQRSSMGSTDALSIVYRDIILNIFNEILYNEQGKLLQDFHSSFSETNNISVVMDRIYEKYEWGVMF